MKRICTLLFICFFFQAPWISAEGQQEDDDFKVLREKMVSTQILSRGINDPLLIDAFRRIPRHLFMPTDVRNQAYADHPVPIGLGQTISQPYVVALMTETLEITKEDTILEIGTGSGYQAAILSLIAKQVYTIEIKELLYQKAAETLTSLGFENIKTLNGDGYFGWEEYAPFDYIMITAAVDHIPIPLFSQLKNGGKMILPLGSPFSYQELVLITKKGESYSINKIGGVLFVPMTGKALDSGKN